MSTTFPSFRHFLLGGCLTLLVTSSAPLCAEATGDAAAETAEKLSSADLEKLLGPIALYPDALVALMLPASTVPTDITLAARFLKAHPDASQFETQSWADSVKALARYPEVLQWMNENLEWTVGLGDAFLAQPAEVMDTIQTLRKKARAAGHLKDTPQQNVVEEDIDGATTLRIQPAEPTTIYVPTYDPQIVYYATPSYFVGNVISFGVGFACGSWLTYDCDWRRQAIYCGPYRPRWNRTHHRRGYRHHGKVSSGINVAHITPRSARRWTPSVRSRSRATRRNVGVYNRYRHTSIPTPRHFTTTQGRYGSHGIQRSASARWGSRTQAQHRRTTRVNPPPNLNLTAGNPSSAARNGRQLTTGSPNARRPNSSRQSRITPTSAAPNTVRRNFVVPSAPPNSSTLQRNRHPQRSATSVRSRQSRTVPVGFDHSRFRVVRPPTTRATISTSNIQRRATSYQPRTRGTRSFQSTRPSHGSFQSQAGSGRWGRH